jgi:ribosome biogenesis protein Nip4
MSGRPYTKEEVVRRGREIYEREIRAKVEPEHDGEFVVVNVESGAYEVSESDVEVSDRALRKNPNAALNFLRVGRPAAYRIGAGSAPRAARGR